MGTIIDGDFKVLFDKYVKPTSKITDYRTHISGILPDHLDEHGSNSKNLLDFATCRTKVLKILRNKILVGHALSNDLNALAICHPWHQIRDTAQWIPFMQIRFNDGVYWPRKLKELVHQHLSYEIQSPGRPHCPYEDATAAMHLYQHVKQAWEQDMLRNIPGQKKYAPQYSNNPNNNNLSQCRHNYHNYGQRQ